MEYIFSYLEFQLQLSQRMFSEHLVLVYSFYMYMERSMAMLLLNNGFLSHITLHDFSELQQILFEIQYFKGRKKGKVQEEKWKQICFIVVGRWVPDRCTSNI